MGLKTEMPGEWEAVTGLKEPKQINLSTIQASLTGNYWIFSLPVKW